MQRWMRTPDVYCLKHQMGNRRFDNNVKVLRLYRMTPQATYQVATGRIKYDEEENRGCLVNHRA